MFRAVSFGVFHDQRPLVPRHDVGVQRFNSGVGEMGPGERKICAFQRSSGKALGDRGIWRDSHSIGVEGLKTQMTGTFRPALEQFCIKCVLNTKPFYVVA